MFTYVVLCVCVGMCACVVCMCVCVCCGHGCFVVVALPSQDDVRIIGVLELCVDAVQASNVLASCQCTMSVQSLSCVSIQQILVCTIHAKQIEI